jgi:hypothetical protein
MGSREAFVRTFRRYPLEDLREAERQFRCGTMSGIQIRSLDGGRVALELAHSEAAALGGLLRALATAVEGSPSAPL